MTTIMDLTIENLDTMLRFVVDPELASFDLMEALLCCYRDVDISVSTFDTEREGFMHQVITEMGLCYSMYTPNTDSALTEYRRIYY